MGRIKDQIFEYQEMKIFDAVKVPMQINDMSYDKGHDIPEGIYLVQIVDVKCHNRDTYRLQVDIVGEVGEDPYPQAKRIIGYARRYTKTFEDLSGCFGDGTVYKRSGQYKGLFGIISLSSSGWISLMDRSLFVAED